jgi:hypothetical protein
MKRRLALGLVLVGCVGYGQENATRQTPVPTLVLGPAQKISLGIPSFGAVGRPACDSFGDVFFNVGSSVTAKGPFLRFAPNGSSHSLYILPTEAKSASGTAWTVSPDGTFVLLYLDSPVYTLLRFKSDGTIAKSTTLQVPADLFVEEIASLDSGVTCVRGYIDTAKKRDVPRTAFAAVYDGMGSKIRDLSAGLQSRDLSTLSEHPAEGDAIAGDDDRFYVLESNDVVVLNRLGELEATFRFRKPDRDSLAGRIDESRGAISVLLDSVIRVADHAPEVRPRAILLNSETGEQIGDYVFAPETTGNVACFRRDKGYTLYAMDGIRAALEIVPLQ